MLQKIQDLAYQGSLSLGVYLCIQADRLFSSPGERFVVERKAPSARIWIHSHENKQFMIIQCTGNPVILSCNNHQCKRSHQHLHPPGSVLRVRLGGHTPPRSGDTRSRYHLFQQLPWATLFFIFQFDWSLAFLLVSSTGTVHCHVATCNISFNSEWNHAFVIELVIIILLHWIKNVSLRKTKKSCSRGSRFLAPPPKPSVGKYIQPAQPLAHPVPTLGPEWPDNRWFPYTSRSPGPSQTRNPSSRLAQRRQRSHRRACQHPALRATSRTTVPYGYSCTGTMYPVQCDNQFRKKIKSSSYIQGSPLSSPSSVSWQIGSPVHGGSSAVQQYGFVLPHVFQCVCHWHQSAGIAWHYQNVFYWNQRY